MQHPSIVVGVEETPSAADALRWAAWQSQMTQAPLLVLHAYHQDEGSPSEIRVTRESVARSWATHWLREQLANCGALPWHVQLVVTPEEPAAALVERSVDARFLVLGQRDATRRGRPSRVTDECETRSRCPVVIVPQGTSLEGTTRDGGSTSEGLSAFRR